MMIKNVHSCEEQKTRSFEECSSCSLESCRTSQMINIKSSPKIKMIFKQNNDNIEQLNKWVKASHKYCAWRQTSSPSSVKLDSCLVGLFDILLLLQYEKAMVCRSVLSKRVCLKRCHWIPLHWWNKITTTAIDLQRQFHLSALVILQYWPNGNIWAAQWSDYQSIYLYYQHIPSSSPSLRCIFLHYQPQRQ